MLFAVDDTALGAARARVAAKLGNPDPFSVRTWLSQQVLAQRVGAQQVLAQHVQAGLNPVLGQTKGSPLTPDAADAVLVSAALSTGADARISGLVGLFAGRPPGPLVRSVPVDDAGADWLRFPKADAPPAHRWGKLESWSTEQIGDAAMATIRCAVAIPGGIALGSDYGLTLWRGGKFEPFPWPAGARREARRVEAMAVHQNELYVATSQCMVVWNFRSEPVIRKFRADNEGGWDEVRALLSTGDQLYVAWRTGLEGGAGPAECFAIVEANGVIYVGTGNGELHTVNGGQLRKLTEGGRHAIRHLAFADGVLHAAGGGKHHRFDGASWTSSAPEPTAFAVDRWGRLWMLAEGKVFGYGRTGPVAVNAAVERPWCLAAAAGRLWIGGKEQVWSLGID